MEVDWGAARFLWDFVQAIVLLVVSIFVWFRTRHRVTAAAIDSLKEEVRSLEKEVNKRTDFGHLDELRKELEHTNRSLAQVSARLEATTSLLNRMHEFMLQGKKG